MAGSEAEPADDLRVDGGECGIEIVGTQRPQGQALGGDLVALPCAGPTRDGRVLVAPALHARSLRAGSGPLGQRLAGGPSGWGSAASISLVLV